MRTGDRLQTGRSEGTLLSRPIAAGYLKKIKITG